MEYRLKYSRYSGLERSGALDVGRGAPSIYEYAFNKQCNATLAHLIPRDVYKSKR